MFWGWMEGESIEDLLELGDRISLAFYFENHHSHVSEDA